MNRVLAAARLQLVHPAVTLGIPWVVASCSFAITWAIWALADLRHEPGAASGGIIALYSTVFVVSVQAVTQLMPFAMGISLSRRTYWLGVTLVGGVSALGYGVALALLSAVGKATDGWGVGLAFWAPSSVQVDGFALQALVCGAPMLLCILAGTGLGVVFKRWGAAGVWVLVILLLLVLGGLGVLVTWRGAWLEVGGWFGRQSLETLTIGLPLLLTALLAALSFWGIRRVVP